MKKSKATQQAMTRREMLSLCSNGFGSLALLGLMGLKAFGNVISDSPMTPRPPHLVPKAKNIIFLYMDGGVSHVDTFDPKPLLDKENGQPFKMKIEPTQFNNNGGVLKSPWEFNHYGQSGTPVSALFPHVASCVDDIAVIRSMVADFSEHTNANYFLHTGHGMQGRPSMGAWITYGLGSDNQDLPGFVVLNGGLIPPGGLDNFTSGFLPASYQGSVFKAGDVPLANIRPSEESASLQTNKLDFIHRMDTRLLGRIGHADQVESSIANYELAYRMQAAVPELTELSGESEATKRLYGLEAEFEHTRTYAAQCLLARRLVERGVRFIELTCPRVKADRWDQHGGLKAGHERNALAVDQPIAGLLKDLKSRGLLDETLVIWAGEFGRTPFSQGKDGRDHHPFGFSIWLAGGGIKGGVIYGATDEYGYKAIENRVTIHDLHATVLHQLGIDHTRLTYRFSGRDIRLTDVYGNVIKDILV
jgi:hypothetical protein